MYGGRAFTKYITVRMLCFEKQEGMTGLDVLAMVWQMMRPFIKEGAVVPATGKPWDAGTVPYWVFTANATGSLYTDRRNDYVALSVRTNLDKIEGLAVAFVEQTTQESLPQTRSRAFTRSPSRSWHARERPRVGPRPLPS